MPNGAGPPRVCPDQSFPQRLSCPLLSGQTSPVPFTHPFPRQSQTPACWAAEAAQTQPGHHPSPRSVPYSRLSGLSSPHPSPWTSAERLRLCWLLKGQRHCVVSTMQTGHTSLQRQGKHLRTFKNTCPLTQLFFCPHALRGSQESAPS